MLPLVDNVDGVCETKVIADVFVADVVELHLVEIDAHDFAEAGVEEG